MTSALELVDEAIAELEARLCLKPGQAPAGLINPAKGGAARKDKDKRKKAANKPKPKPKQQASSENLPDICKLQFTVGEITKVWEHPNADKLYCEEIRIGPGDEDVREIASGLRPHFTLEQMMGQRLLVVSNLKPKKLVGFKSHGMVLCAAAPKEDGKEIVEFVEPPADAPVGEVVSFEGLPEVEAAAPSQVEKRKLWQACQSDMKTTDDRAAAWKGHIFMTTAGPCKTKSIAGGILR